MKATFWGVRGSIPTPPQNSEIRDKMVRLLKGARDVDLSDKQSVNDYLDSLPVTRAGVVGGNTACVELRIGEHLIIFDCGSGMRPLGLSLMAGEFGHGKGIAHIFLGHTHWDHLMGFPFFVPAYIPGNILHFYGCHPDLHSRFNDQQAPEHFPVPMDAMASEKHFHQLQPGQPLTIEGAKITPFEMFHPGGSFGYRVEHDGKVFVYASDTEFKSTQEKDTQPLRDADVLVLDTMYTFEEALAKTDWGHCSPFIGVDIALAENVHNLVLFHHEPTYTDRKLEQVLHKTIQYKEKMAPDSDLQVHLAWEGLEIEIGT